MRKWLIVATVTVILALAVVSPVVAQRPVDCPPRFSLEHVDIAHHWRADRNGDELICVFRPREDPLVYVYIDNVIPE